MNKKKLYHALSYHDWSITYQLPPEFVRAIVSDCSIPDYLLDPIYSDSNIIAHVPKNVSSYRCYLLACLEVLNELYWTHCNGGDPYDVVYRSLGNCFSQGQCWRYVSPLAEAAIDDLPTSIGENVGVEDAWDWVDASFQEGLRAGQIYSMDTYRNYASGVCKILAFSDFWGGIGVSAKGILDSEGLMEGTSRIDGIVVLEVARHLAHAGKTVASKALLNISSKDESSILARFSPEGVYAKLAEQGVPAVFEAITSGNQDKARRSSGAISNSVFRTLNCP